MARTTWLAAATTLLMSVASASADDAAPVCWRPWRYGYAPAPIVYAPPTSPTPTNYYPAREIAPPPAPASNYQPLPGAREAVTTPPRPTIVVGYQGRFFSGSIAIPLGNRLRNAAAAVPPPAVAPERSPPPRPGESFRYDGGPANPVPMPAPDVTPPTDPVPTTVPALQRVAWQRSRPNVNYPSFGERTGSRPAEPLLVRRTAYP